jgi:trans-aconitate 2-methyltransferase
MTADRAGGAYQFGDTDRAAERLRLLADAFEPSTRDFLRELAPQNPARIADLGCGPGYTTRLLAEVFPRATIRGLDSSASFLALAAKSPHPRVNFEVADVTRGLPGGPYDLVYSRYLLTHVAAFTETICLWSGELAPGGLIAIEENEWIRTRSPEFAEYLAIVEAMLANGGQKLYVGAELDALDRWPSLVKTSSRLVPIEVSASVTAEMFLLNLRCWREQAFIRERYRVDEIGRLEIALQALAEGPHVPAAITFGRRRLTLARGDSQP